MAGLFPMKCFTCGQDLAHLKPMFENMTMYYQLRKEKASNGSEDDYKFIFEKEDEALRFYRNLNQLHQTLGVGEIPEGYHMNFSAKSLAIMTLMQKMPDLELTDCCFKMLICHVHNNDLNMN